MSGLVAGIGVGLLCGWSLGVSRLVPNAGTPMWVLVAAGIVLIIIGLGRGFSDRTS